MLQRVITEGGGKNAYVAGYKLGGKSGTSQKLDSGDSSARIASFMAFAPADDPQIAILVICDEPTAGEFYGSIVSAPIVGSILADTLPYLGIDPIYDESEMEKLDVYVPSVVNQKPLEAGSTLRKRGLDSTLIGNGDTVIKQIPEAGKPVPKGGKVILYTEEVEKQVTVPKLTGLTGEQVKQVATNAELNIRFTGSTLSGSKVISVKQDPAQDTKVAAGTVVTVEMRTKDATD